MSATPSTCPACGAAEAFKTDLREDLPRAPDAALAGACIRCGYVTGEKNRCPHCKVVARIDGVGEKAVCAQCGGPRIIAGYGGEVAADALLEQRRALAIARLNSVAALLQQLIAAVVAAVGLVARPESVAGLSLVIGFAVLPLLLSFRSRSRARRARENATNAGDRAWQAAAEDVAARTTEGVTAAGLAATLGIDAVHADRLLTSLTVQDRTRIDVGDDAEVRYSSTEEEVASETGAIESERLQR